MSIPKKYFPKSNENTHEFIQRKVNSGKDFKDEPETLFDDLSSIIRPQEVKKNRFDEMINKIGW
jgi:hypothetical protein